MDKFIIVVCFDDAHLAGYCFGRFAKSVIVDADNLAGGTRYSCAFYTNIPEEAFREYDRLGRVSQRHRPLPYLRRV